MSVDPPQSQSFPVPKTHFIPLQQHHRPRDPSAVWEVSPEWRERSGSRAAVCPLLQDNLISALTTIWFRLGFKQQSGDEGCGREVPAC